MQKKEYTSFVLVGTKDKSSYDGFKGDSLRMLGERCYKGYVVNSTLLFIPNMGVCFNWKFTNMNKKEVND